MRILRLSIVLTLASISILLALACGSSDTASPPRGIEPAGQACTTAAQCYAGVDGGADSGAIKGAVTCITKVTNGYCTHVCTRS